MLLSTFDFLRAGDIAGRGQVRRRPEANLP